MVLHPVGHIFLLVGGHVPATLTRGIEPSAVIAEYADEVDFDNNKYMATTPNTIGAYDLNFAFI